MNDGMNDDTRYPQRASRFSITVKRNCSISPQGCLRLLATTALLCVGIAAAFACFGAWMILPFAGLEMLALTTAFYLVGRHAADHERIELENGILTVQVHEAGRNTEHRFNPAWARLVVEEAPSNLRVAICSQGRELEIGRHLDRGRRNALATELQQRLTSY
jgi:uncharacterized membrane protein